MYTPVFSVLREYVEAGCPAFGAAVVPKNANHLTASAREELVRAQAKRGCELHTPTAVSGARPRKPGVRSLVFENVLSLSLPPSSTHWKQEMIPAS